MVTQLAIKTDAKVKKAAQKKAAEQGVTLTIVVNTFLKKFGEGGFELELNSTADADVQVDELFQSPKIVKKANEIARYINKTDL